MSLENVRLPDDYPRKNGGILAIPRKLLPLSETSRADGLLYWRERILFAILLTAVIVTFFIILKLDSDQKAIIASGFAETDRVKEAQRLGAGAYIKKPYTMEKIAQVVRIELDK